jgi:hypothetical protein
MIQKGKQNDKGEAFRTATRTHPFSDINRAKLVSILIWVKIIRINIAYAGQLNNFAPTKSPFGASCRGLLCISKQ